MSNSNSSNIKQNKLISVILSVVMVASLFVGFGTGTDEAYADSSPYVTFEFFENDGETPLQATLTPVYTVAGSNLQYSIDGGGSWTGITSGSPTPSANKILVRGSGRNALFTGTATTNAWTTTATKLKVSGNINTLLDYNSPPSTVNAYGFSNMFYNCTALIEAPDLPAGSLADWCYAFMFSGCTSLVSAPELPATNLTASCYRYMFQNCTSLVSAPELPATSLTSYCYNGMFSGCDSLVDAPDLPATTLVEGSYTNMFSGCTNLSYISVAFTSWTAATNGWTTSVAGSGIFIKPSALTTTTGVDNIPSGWTVSTSPCTVFSFYGADGTTPTSATLTPKYTNDTSNNLQYSTDGTTWTNIASGTPIPSSANKILVRGSGRNTLFTSAVIGNAWTTTAAKMKVSGNINTLLDYNNPPTTLGSYAFAYMFYNSPLIETPRLPATTLAQNCYAGLFRNCSSLTDAPILPSTNLAPYCYEAMFASCTSLVNAPELPAANLATGCYETMFAFCTSLADAPELPATDLADKCYSEMFYSCSLLTTAPYLPGATLAENCYYRMFYNCSNLNHISVNFTDWTSATDATTNWVYGVSASGVFERATALAFERSNDRIPTNWYANPSLTISPSAIELVSGYEENTSAGAITDGGGTAVYQVDTDVDTSGTLIDSATGTITIPAGLTEGTFTVGIKVTTEYGSDTKDFVIHVTANNPVTKQFDVTFDANGGTVDNKTKIIKSIDEKTKIGELPSAKKSGYEFKGWYTKKSGGEKITKNTKVTENVTYYAHYAKIVVKIKIKITFNVNKGTFAPGAAKSKTVTEGKNYGKLPKANRTGYTFKGWYTKKSGGIKITAKTKVTVKKTQTLYAQWKAKTKYGTLKKGVGALYVRNAPSLHVNVSHRIGVLVQGDVFKVIKMINNTGTKNDWYKIKYKGKKGYVYAPYVKTYLK